MDLLKATTKSLSAGLLMLAFAAAPLAAIAPAPSNCEALKQWALDHRGELPGDYKGMLAYSLEERRAIYGELSAVQKAAFWQDKVAAYLSAHRELSAAQVDAIRAAASAVRPEIYGWQKADADPLAQVAKEARAALGDRIVQEVFYGFGPATDGKAGVASSLKPGLSGTCDCRNLGDCDLGIHNACGSDGSPCTQVSGCGFSGTQACIRNCILLP